LVESDYNNADMVTQMTWEMVLVVAEVKGWRIEEDWDENQEQGTTGAVKQLEENWTRFKVGNHPLRSKGREKTR